jgi:hypothetical protein
MVVQRSNETGTAKTLLEHYQRNGRVESKSPQEFETDMVRTAEEIKKTLPRGISPEEIIFSSGRIATGGWREAITCPTVYISVRRREEALPSVVRWAQRTVAHYGQDRVRYGYTLVVHADARGPLRQHAIGASTNPEIRANGVSVCFRKRGSKKYTCSSE